MNPKITTQSTTHLWEIPVTYLDGFTAGLSEGIRRCRKTVDNLKINSFQTDVLMHKTILIILAAIDAIDRR
jgi:hypothetical protein